MNFERLPRYIYRDDCIFLDEYKIIKEKDLREFMKSKEEEFLIKAYASKKRDIIQQLEDEALDRYISKAIKEFVNKSYLIENDNKNVDNTEEDDSLNYKKCYNKFSTLSNSILRQIKKDRKNDYDDVLKKLKEMLLKNDSIIIDEEAEDDLEEVVKDIEEKVKSEDNDKNEEKNKLKKYLNKQYNEIHYNAESCFLQLSKEEVKRDYPELEDGINIILSEYMTNYKNKYLGDYLSKIDSRIDYLFNMIIIRYKKNINFVDDTSKVYLVNPGSFGGSINRYKFQSGRGRWSRAVVKASNRDRLERFGSMFTLLLSGDNSIKEIMEEE